MEQLKFVLNDFDGPLDLLLTLISKNKMNIYDIPIASLFEQYMEYIEQARMMDMEIAGEFIAMASYLMALKSRTLLPRLNDEEEDPRMELSEILLEYKRTKESVPYLSQAYGKYGGRFAKDTEEISVNDGPFEGRFEASVLFEAFSRVMLRMKENEEANANVKKPFEVILNTYVKPVHEMIGVIVERLSSGPLRFEELLGVAKTRSELVASFLAVLEMLNTQRLDLEQRDDGIYIMMNENYSGDETDGQLAEFEEYN